MTSFFERYRLQIIAVSVSAALSGCLSQDMTLERPQDEVAEHCREGSHPSLGRISCMAAPISAAELKRYAATPLSRIGKRGLVALYDPGSVTQGDVSRYGSLSLPSPSLTLSGEDRALIVNNVLLQMTIAAINGRERTEKYAGTFFVRRSKNEPVSVGLKHSFVLALIQATKRFDSVDVLVLAHGSPGYMVTATSPSGKSTELLYSGELAHYAEQYMSFTQRKKVRAVFLSPCYAASAPGESSTSDSPNAAIESEDPSSAPREFSLLEGYAKAFPRALVSGTPDRNYGPIHLTLRSFEAFVTGLDYHRAVTEGNRTMNYRLGTSGKLRTVAGFGNLYGRGCAQVGTAVCKDKLVGTPRSGYSRPMIEGSLAKIMLGGLRQSANVSFEQD